MSATIDELSEQYSQVVLEEETDANHAKVGSGESVHRKDFAYVGDPDVKSTWKYPIHDAGHVRNALARWGQHKGIPKDEEAGVLRRILKAAKKFKVDYDPEKYKQAASDLCGHHHLAVYLSTVLPAPVMLNGKATYEMPVAVVGSWVKGDHHFSITRQDLRDIVENFDKRQNEMIVIDYEHASENPEVARGDAVPAAGWIHQLFVDPANLDLLKSRVEWTPRAQQMIQGSEYRFFSPALDWGACDKETGKPQGVTMTSGALTNHPFLEELPPIHLTAAYRSQDAVLCSDLAADKSHQGGRITMAEDKPRLARLTGIKIKAGEPHAGHICMRDPSSNPVGYMTKGHLSDLAARHLPSGDDDEEQATDFTSTEKSEEMTRRSLRKADTEEMTRLRALNAELTAKLAARAKDNGDDDDKEQATERVLGELGVSNFALSEVRTMVEHGREAARSAGLRTLMSECCKDGKFDKSRAGAAIAASKGVITLEDYTRLDTANDALNSAILTGKILPRDRSFFLRDAVERPTEFAEFVKKAVPVVQLGIQGHGTTENVDVDVEVNEAITACLSEKGHEGWSRSKAHEHVMRSNRDLETRYHQAHRQIADGSQGSGVPNLRRSM